MVLVPQFRAYQLTQIEDNLCGAPVTFFVPFRNAQRSPKEYWASRSR